MSDEATVFLSADWVLVGADAGKDGVMVLASSTLTEAEIKAVYEFGGIFDRPRREHNPFFSHYELGGKMHNIVICTGATYEEALRAVLKVWHPDDGPGVERPGVEYVATKAIPR